MAKICATCNRSDRPLNQCARCCGVSYCSRDCQSQNWVAHKAVCKRQNYLLHVHLCPEDEGFDDPPITRTLSCPAAASWIQLHAALQIAFGWATTHSFDFTVLDPDYEERPDPNPGLTDEQRMKLEFIRMNMSINGGVNESDPQPYLCRISDPPKSQDQMMFQVDRMHEGRRKHPNTVEKDSKKTKLWQILEDQQYADEQIVYTYDFGDNWEHHITVAGRSPATDRFECTDGSGHYVAEDVTRAGWPDLIEAYRASRPTKEQKDQMRWFEREASNADSRGLKNGREHYWEKDKINQRLASLSS